MTTLDEVTVSGARWERYGVWFIRALPYFLSALSAGLAATSAADGLTPWWRYFASLAVMAAAVAWQVCWDISGAVEREDAAAAPVALWAGRIVLAAVLVALSPWYGVFAWLGYFDAKRMRGRWQMIAIVATAFVMAGSITGGYPGPHLGRLLAYGLSVMFSSVLAGGFVYFTTRYDQQSSRRRDVIVALVDSNQRLETALRENAGLHAQLVTQAREAGIADERARMAREIHDTLAQGLTGIVTQLQAAEQTATVPEQWRRHLELAQRLARDSLTEARRSVHALRPAALSDRRLPEALDTVAREWSAMHGVRAEMTTSGEPATLRPEVEIALLRTAQEGLANVGKHARAQRVGLTLSYMDDVVMLDVRDDGAGFDPEALPPAGPSGGFGLGAMRQRVTDLGGVFEVESDSCGTAISARLPLFMPSGRDDDSAEAVSGGESRERLTASGGH